MKEYFIAMNTLQYWYLTAIIKAAIIPKLVKTNRPQEDFLDMNIGTGDNSNFDWRLQTFWQMD